MSTETINMKMNDYEINIYPWRAVYFSIPTVYLVFLIFQNKRHNVRPVERIASVWRIMWFQTCLLGIMSIEKMGRVKENIQLGNVAK